MKSLSFDWNDLKFFIAVVRSGGLSTAAAELGTSPSTVSRHIDALEHRLGRTLFLRRQSGYLLTDEGSDLAVQVGQVEQAMLTAERSAAQEELSGVVRLATTEMLAQYLVAPKLPVLRARHPALRIELNIAMERADLTRRDADLALRLAAPDSASGDYIAKCIGKIEFGLYRSSGGTGHCEEYVGWDGAWNGLPMAASLRAAFNGKPPALACNSLPAQIAAVRAGVGAGLLPCFIGDADPRLQRMERETTPLSRDLWLVYHRDLKASLRVRAMADFLAGELRLPEAGTR